MTTSTKFAARAFTIGALALLVVTAMPAAASAGAKTLLVSQSGGGVKGNSVSNEPSISQTGRWIAFNSGASNLVPNDTNGRHDCFVRDNATKTTERVSVVTGGGQSNGRCYGPAISDDGRWVAFESNATDLGGSTNGKVQVYLHDRNLDTTVLVSESRSGGQGGDGYSGDPAISRDGRFVTFESQASNLRWNDTNGFSDVYLWDRLGVIDIKRVSVRSGGAQGNGASSDPDISADGKFIVFDSFARNLVNNDKNGRRDCFLHNRVTGKTVIVSLNSQERRGNGACSDASVSSNGRWVAFASRATNMTQGDRSTAPDIFVRDRKLGKTVQVSLSSRGQQASGWSGDPSISNNGRYIAFESTAGNLVRKDPNKRWDVFLRDRVQRTTKILSKRANGLPAWGDSDDPAISGDGRFVAFESEAKKIVLKDQDALEDIFRRGPLR